MHGTASNSTLFALENVIRGHVSATDTLVINGTYRGIPVTHYVNPQTGLNVIQSTSGNMISGWKLNPSQLTNVMTRGSL
ncbi:colicin D domain-containing protein [Ottowia sp.]|uniref:colicin D domain-containing protein n=1 Tax=Ottowia sp. TaxID=1898956 RepID=UPI0039E4867D